MLNILRKAANVMLSDAEDTWESAMAAEITEMRNGDFLWDKMKPHLGQVFEIVRRYNEG